MFWAKVTFDSHENVILNEEQGAYHTYIKAHIAIYMNVMDIVLNNNKNTNIVTYVIIYTLLPNNVK